MVYKDGFIAIVACNGKILREAIVAGEQVVTLPFMSDYSLLLKNKEARRAQVKVEIDGKDVLGGTSLIVAANSEVRLEGFLEGSTVRNKFRFIRKTQEIVEHRGDRADDGLIRIEFCFEQLKEERADHYHYHYDYTPDRYWPYPPVPLCTWKAGIIDCNSSQVVDQPNVVHQTFTDLVPGDQISCSFTGSSSQAIDNIGADEGITAPGAFVHQEFNHASIGALESNSHVIIIRLRGTTQSGANIAQPVTVKDKLTCSSCGKKWSSDHKFCGSCGTALV